MAKSASPVISFQLPSLQTKSEKLLTTLKDGLRVLYWQQFKQENKDNVGKGKLVEDYLKLYDEFDPLWKSSEVHQWDLNQLRSEIQRLGYSVEDINQVRKEYYEAKKGITATIQATVTPEEAPTEVIPY